MSEFIATFSPAGDFVGSVPRPDLYRSSENAHRIVHHLIYHPLGTNMQPEQMWVQARNADASFLPGHLVSAASGHLNMADQKRPETFEEAVLRETAEELFATTVIPAPYQMTRLGRDFLYLPDYSGYTGGQKHIATFVSESDGRLFSPSPSEVGELKLYPVGELKEMARDSLSPLHPEFREILKRKMVRIGVVGTYSVGKTTLTNELGKRIKGAAGITEDVRHYVKNIFGKKGIQELTPEEFIQLEHMLFRDQTLASRMTDIAIIDSTPIGCPVYLQNYGMLAENGHQFDEATVQGWIQKTQQTLKEYDLIVYLPPEIPFENDGFRTPPRFRGPIDEGFRTVIDGHPRVIEVTGYVPGDVQTGVDKRVSHVLQACLDSGILDESQIV